MAEETRDERRMAEGTSDGRRRGRGTSNGDERRRQEGEALRAPPELDTRQNARGASRLNYTPTRRGFTGFFRALPTKPGLTNNFGVFSGVLGWAGNLHGKTSQNSPTEQGLKRYATYVRTAGWLSNLLGTKLQNWHDVP